MDRNMKEIQMILEARILREAAQLFCDSLACFPHAWRTGLVKLDTVLGILTAWWWTKLTGLKEADIEPEVIQELRREAEQNDQ